MRTQSFISASTMCRSVLPPSRAARLPLASCGRDLPRSTCNEQAITPEACKAVMFGGTMPFDTFLIGNEPAIRLGVFASTFAIIALWELFAPRRALENSKTIRWANNLALAAVNIFFVRVLFPSAVVGVALFADERGVGLLHMFSIAYPLAMILSLLALDLQMYLTHLMFHAVPALWRVPRVHHADVDFDVTTGMRFHPLQTVLMVPIKVAVIFVLGPPVLAVPAVENAVHCGFGVEQADNRLPPAADRLARLVI